MNLLAFVVVLAAGILGVVILATTTWKNLVGWAITLLSVGVIIQEVLTKWSHSVHQ
jgi:hypothetical protein